MAIGVHVVRVNVVPVDSAGQFIDKNAEAASGATIGEMTDFSNEHRVIPDLAVPMSAGYPSVPDYIAAEALINYVVYYMDQNMIITYEHAAGPLP